MLVTQKAGNLQTYNISNKSIDLLPLEWYETNKRIMHKRSVAGREILMKFLKENPALLQDDILYEGEDFVVVVDIRPCEAIVVKPASMYQMACICYEIGNKHLPVFYHADEVLVAYEEPLFRLLTNAGFEPVRQYRRLQHPLTTTVAPHGQSSSLLSKILQLTTQSDNA